MRLAVLPLMVLVALGAHVRDAHGCSQADFQRYFAFAGKVFQDRFLYEDYLGWLRDGSRRSSALSNAMTERGRMDPSFLDAATGLQLCAFAGRLVSDSDVIRICRQAGRTSC